MICGQLSISAVVICFNVPSSSITKTRTRSHGFFLSGSVALPNSASDDLRSAFVDEARQTYTPCSSVKTGANNPGGSFVSGTCPGYMVVQNFLSWANFWQSTYAGNPLWDVASLSTYLITVKTLQYLALQYRPSADLTLLIVVDLLRLCAYIRMPLRSSCFTLAHNFLSDVTLLEPWLQLKFQHHFGSS